MDQLAVGGKNRSAVIETAIREYLARRARARRDQHDLDVLNRNADALNREAADVLDFQVER